MYFERGFSCRCNLWGFPTLPSPVRADQSEDYKCFQNPIRSDGGSTKTSFGKYHGAVLQLQSWSEVRSKLYCQLICLLDIPVIFQCTFQTRYSNYQCELSQIFGIRNCLKRVLTRK